MFGRKKLSINKQLDPDEIFMDAKNVPGFREESFEGVIERAIERRTPIVMLAVFLCIFLALVLRAGYLEIARGAEYAERARDNGFVLTPLDPKRGMIYDRRFRELAWSIITPDNGAWRAYSPLVGLGHILGYVGYPTEEEIAAGFVHDRKYGRSGVEAEFDELLRGEFGERLVEVDSHGTVVSESVQKPPRAGETITLTIDAELQSQLFQAIREFGEERGFEGGAGAVLDPLSGEVLALASWPEYDSAALSAGNAKKISAFSAESSSGVQPFFFRAISGLYAPGSIIKPIVALAALKEGVIDENKQIYSAGYISIPNPYNSSKPSIFKDWKAHGWVDLRRAIAVSSDVYFYSIGGGYDGLRGLGAARLKQYLELFGLGRKTGIDLAGESEGFVPSPEWKKESFSDGVWRLGDSYNMSIGQGYIQVTPIQMAAVAAAIAEDGKIIKPRILKSVGKPADILQVSENTAFAAHLDIAPQFFRAVKEGMKLAAQSGGTAQALSGLPVAIGGKTGTAEVGMQKKQVNSWIIAFLPYDKPRLALAVVMERGDARNLVGAPAVARRFLDWVVINRPEYLGDQ